MSTDVYRSILAGLFSCRYPYGILGPVFGEGLTADEARARGGFILDSS